MIRAVSPDIILLDWEMPGIDGAEFVRLVRSSGSLSMPGVPIIMLTGHDERWRVREAVRLGVHEFLLKPVSSETLRDRILSVLAKPQATANRRYASELRDSVSADSQADERVPARRTAVDPAA
jgi:DNA-binding NarL/FixJ family response regulator